MKIDTIKQIKAIMSAKEYELKKELGLGENDEIPWSVTKQEVIDYTIKNGFPKGWAHTSPQTYDGIYILNENSGWVVYYKERGVIYENKEFQSYSEAMNYLIGTYYTNRLGIE